MNFIKNIVIIEGYILETTRKHHNPTPRENTYNLVIKRIRIGPSLWEKKPYARILGWTNTHSESLLHTHNLLAKGHRVTFILV
jgi:hypothetical protein